MGIMFVDTSWKVKTTWSILNVMIPSLLEVAGRGDLRCALGWCWSLAEPPGGVQLVLNPALTRLGWVQSSTFCQGQIALPFPPLQSSFRILLVMFRTIPVTADCSVLFPQKKKKKQRGSVFLHRDLNLLLPTLYKNHPFSLFFSQLSLSGLLLVFLCPWLLLSFIFSPFYWKKLLLQWLCLHLRYSVPGGCVGSDKA